MPHPQPYSPDVAAQLAADVVSRLPPHFVQTDADRDRLTATLATLATFLTRCAPTTPVAPAPSTDDNSTPSP